MIVWSGLLPGGFANEVGNEGLELFSEIAVQILLRLEGGKRRCRAIPGRLNCSA